MVNSLMSTHHLKQGPTVPNYKSKERRESIILFLIYLRASFRVDIFQMFLLLNKKRSAVGSSQESQQRAPAEGWGTSRPLASTCKT